MFWLDPLTAPVAAVVVVDYSVVMLTGGVGGAADKSAVP